jgi:hypothetical protein
VDIGIGFFPEIEEVLVCGTGVDCITRHRGGASQGR